MDAATTATTMPGLTWEQYADLEGINATVLKEGRRSMKHLQHRLKTAREDTIRLGLGRAAHCLILEPDMFPLNFAVWAGGRRAGKQWDEFCAANRGRTIIKADEYAHCRGMRDAVMAHPIAGPLLRKPGERETVIQWDDPLTGIRCKARLDDLTADEDIDLKTSADLEAHRFGSLAARYGYHMQMGFHAMGLRVLGLERAMKLVAVEPTPPYDVAVFTVGDDALYAGEEEVRGLLDKVATGLHSGIWPGRYEDGEIPLELPAYCFPDTEVASDLGIIIGSRQEE